MVDEAGVWAGERGGASIGQSRSRLSRSYYVFFPLYLRMWNNTVMLLFSRTELWASKQYYFLTSLLPLFVCSNRIMCWEGRRGGGQGGVSFSYMMICLFPPVPTQFCKYQHYSGIQ